MPLLYQSCCRDRRQICEAFRPFAFPSTIEGMIIGNDLDALLSACLLKKIFGWDVVAIYDYRNLWIDRRLTEKFINAMKNGKYLAVDLDIYRNTIPSIGHHILQVDENDRLEKHAQTLNPNILFGVNCQTFQKKYPLATIHLIRWLYEVELDRRGELLCWLADSAYINAQSHRFRDNVSDWLLKFYDWPPFWEIFILLDSVTYEDLLVQEIGGQFKNKQLISSSGQVRSRFNALSGWQCQWQDPEQESNQIRSVLKIIQDITDWPVPIFPEKYSRINGFRNTISVTDMIKKFICLDSFLETQNVFSYVFPFKDQINYTFFD